jgi:hypothetical protein
VALGSWWIAVLNGVIRHTPLQDKEVFVAKIAANGHQHARSI